MMESRRTTCLAVAVFAALLTGIGHAQDQSKTPSQPKPSSPGLGAYEWWARAGLTCGAGASISDIAGKPAAQCGALFGLPYFDLETGIMGPQAHRSSASGYLSANGWIPLYAMKDAARLPGVPLVTGGYTRMFETGHALDYGFAYAHPIDDEHSIQFEVRDYWTFANPDQHNVVFRVVWLVGLPD